MNQIFTVSRISFYIKDMFRRDEVLNHVSVSGEVGSLKYHSSGHIYFTIKDDSSALNCVMWRSSIPAGLKFKLEEGQKIIVTGSIETYEKTGVYQLYARNIELDGEGKLYAEFDKLKKKLSLEGLFDEAHKKPIPRFPGKVGVVTASTGAAIHDIMTVSERRDPYVQLILAPAKVQGEDAPGSIIRAIKMLDSYGVDTIIVGRGGGSLEDLWCFNDEGVARAIYDCNTPVISAVGHEVDFTIADFVSDLRAATPSAAAELAVPDVEEYLSMLDGSYTVLKMHFAGKIRIYKEKVKQYELRLSKDSPQSRLFSYRQSVDEAEDKLFLQIKHQVEMYKRLLDSVEKKLNADIDLDLEKTNRRLAVLAAKLEGLSPLTRLSGGYSYTENEKGENISTIKQVKQGEVIRVNFTDGYAKAKVNEIGENDYGG